MDENQKPRKGLISILVTIIGDAIISVIRIWKILKSPSIRKEFFQQQKLKAREEAVRKKLEDQRARRIRKKSKLSRLRVLARLQRMRLARFHRRTPTKRLFAIYLIPVSVLSVLFCIILLFNQPKVRTQHLPASALTEQQRLKRLLGETARLINANRMDEAEKKLQALTALAPDNPTVLTHTGAVHLVKKSYEQARIAYHRALAVDPDNYVARHNLSEIEFVSKNYPEAERRFTELLDGSPRDETIFFRLYLCALLQNDSARAGEYFNNLSPTGRTPAWYYAAAARLFWEKNDSEARKMLDQGRTLYTGDNTFFDSTFEGLGFIK